MHDNVRCCRYLLMTPAWIVSMQGSGCSDLGGTCSRAHSRAHLQLCTVLAAHQHAILSSQIAASCLWTLHRIQTAPSWKMRPVMVLIFTILQSQTGNVQGLA